MKNQEKGFGKLIFPGAGAWAEVLRDPPEPHFLEKSRKGASKPNFPGARAWAKALRDSRKHHFVDKIRKIAFSSGIFGRGLGKGPVGFNEASFEREMGKGSRKKTIFSAATS